MYVGVSFVKRTKKEELTQFYERRYVNPIGIIVKINRKVEGFEPFLICPLLFQQKYRQ